MSGTVQEQQAATPAVEETPAAPPVEPEAPTSLDDALGDPTPEELEAAQAPVEPAAETVEPGSGEPSAAVETPAPNADAGGVAAGGEDAEETVSVEVLPDGKGYKMGKYQAATLEELAVQIEKGRRNAEKLVGKKKEELADDPFLYNEDEFDGEDPEYELVDDDLGAQIGAGVAQALAQSGFVAPGHQDQHALLAQAIGIAQQAIDSPRTTDDEFRGVLAALIQADPSAHDLRQTVLDEWGQRNPVAAAQEASRIEIAFAQHQQFVQQQQQMQQAQQQFEQEQTVTAEQQQGVQEFQFGQQVFVQEKPDWQQRDAGMTAWLKQHPWLMEQAKQVPLVNPDNPRDRPRARAVRDVLTMAYEQTAPAPVAGVSGGVSEQGTNMGVVSNPNTIDPVAAASSLAAEQRDLAGLETGAAVDEVTITLANPNPPGLAETSFEELVGIPTVKQ